MPEIFKEKGPSKLTSFGKFSKLAKHACKFLFFLFLKFLESTYGVYKCLWVLQIGKTCECVDDKNIHVILFFVNLCIALFICVEFHRILAGVSIVIHHYVLGSTCPF
jgi:hypothetical protein